MSKFVTKLISPRVLCTSITNSGPSWFDRFTAYYNCMSKKVTKLISPRVLCTSITNRIFSWFDRFKAYYNCMSEIYHKTHISASSVHKCHKTCSELIWPFYGLLLLYEKKMSQNSYFHEFCAQMSQIVFLTDLTVLRLVITVSAKFSVNSYLHEFCARLSQIVFLVELTVIRFITTVWKK